MDLPLPIATLLRRARNAKSPKERHDTAYFAWEASLRLAVAARPPAEAAALAMPSVGQWVGAFEGGPAPLDPPPLLAAFALFTEVGLGTRSAPRAVLAKALLEPLAAYRNQVIGHGSTRAAGFYDRAAGALLDGLEAAWAAGVFWPEDARLLFVDSVEIDGAGARRARTLALSGLAPALESAPGEAAADVLPRRLYLRAGGRLLPLHPWLLYDEAGLRERVLFFGGRARTAQYLDYVSGEALRGKALAEAFPALDADLDALFARARPPVAAEAEPAPDPSRFGDYRLLGKLGEGGMGVVHLARQEGLGRLVALKMLPLDAAQDAVAVARFEREIAALSRCDHPNVVKIHASGEAQGTRYYAMELVEGADLAEIAAALPGAGDFDGAVASASERVRRAKADAFTHVPTLPRGEAPGPRPKDRPRRLAALFRDAARAVHHLHEVGVIHRDLKPGNLMVTAADHRVVVMDLGLAALGDASRSITRDRSALLGTLRYMPPEQLQRNLVALDRRADVYSLGATLYELVTDRKFFDGDSEARLLGQVLRETPVPAERAGRGVPRDLSVIIQKATEKDPARRYESAAALAADLDAFLGGRPIAARAPTLVYVLRLAIARNRALAAALAAAALLAVAGTAFFLARESGLRREAERLGGLAALREAEAVAERRRAEERLDEIKRLADVKRLADYEQAANALWPAVPENAAAMGKWLEKAWALAAWLPAHRAKLVELRAAALPYDDAARARDRATHPDAPRLERFARTRAEKAAAHEPPDAELDARVADLEREVGARQTWAFADDEAQWEHDTLAGLVRGLERFIALGATVTPSESAIKTPRASEGAIASVEARLAIAETIRERSIERPRDAWAAAIEAIADPRRAPLYRGLRIRPQLGLVPLGQDPRSGLFEFADLETGEPPARRADGTLALDKETGIVLVLVPGGRFRMGAVRPDAASPGETNVDPEAEDDEAPVHEHAVPAFFLSKYEMTQGQWLRFVGLNPSEYRPGRTVGDKVVTFLHPVEQVSYVDATDVLRRLGLRLPSEAEWEYAARAGQTTTFISGADARSIEGAANVADRNCKEHGGGSPSWAYEEWLDDGYAVHAPVGSYRPNGFGLHDMAGNVWEWCADCYDPKAYERFARGEATPLPGPNRVVRGGGWDRGARFCASAYRDTCDPHYRNVSLGVRPARSVAE
jgi:formylglycine-generating enzyme required for sulfatase activity/serine/threonine protein kinase